MTGVTMIRKIALLLALAVAGIVPTAAATAQPQTVPSTASLDSEFAVMGGDDASSALLPDGQVLWVFGDTLWDGSQTICNPSVAGGCAYGYPHDSFALQASPGASTITPAVDSSLPYGLQRIPNASDGTMYWPGLVVSASGDVFILCAHMNAAGTKVLGSTLAVFNSSLIYQSMVSLPSPDLWSSAVRVSGGWWMGGSSEPDAGSSAKVGDVAFVPVGDWRSPSKWTIHNGVMPLALNVGTAVALHDTSSGWQAWTKLGDAYGSNLIEELTAPSVTGPWTEATTIPAPYPNTGDITYSVNLHPEQPAPAGQILLSYAVNYSNTADWRDYHPLFAYVP